MASEHPDASTHAKGRADTGDRVLLSQHTDVIGAFQKHFHQISPGTSPFPQKGFQPCCPLGLFGIKTQVLAFRWMGCDQTARLRQASIMEN